MDNRIKLQSELEKLMESRNVYYQPPESKKMSYPAIRYSLMDIDTKYASNKHYIQKRAYQIIVIDEDPDSEYTTKMSQFNNATFNRHYEKDNLNHDVFTLYY